MFTFKFLYHTARILKWMYAGNQIAVLFLFYLSITKYFLSYGLLVPEGIILPVVSASVMTWFIRYIYYWNLQFLNHVIIIKTSVLLPQAPKKVLLSAFPFLPEYHKVFSFISTTTIYYIHTLWNKHYDVSYRNVL
jgi:hypothetical protein